MNCPLFSIELKMAYRQGVEIDYCPQCRGVWLDRGELDKIIERSASIPSEKMRRYREPQYI
ncbi:MAG: zf-TFIIB domain-containing protein [Syntrophaceae bacterium]|nr:zf-TFIIB domain-containing protein [Syntrophaceae bacterium]